MKKRFKSIIKGSLLTVGLILASCGKKQTNDVNTPSDVSNTDTSTSTSTSTTTDTSKETSSVSTTSETTTNVGNASTTTTTEIVEQEYLITFKNEDGSLIDSFSVKEGVIPQAPENPTKEADETYTYQFAGWDKEIVSATQDETYFATYNKTYIDYVIEFVDYDNSPIDKKTYHYGEAVVEPASPTRESDEQYTYEFAGWDSEITAVTGAKTYKATYKSTLRKYLISFVDYNGTPLSSAEVEYGKLPTAPTNPTREGNIQYTYQFAGWDSEVTVVTGAKTYTY